MTIPIHDAFRDNLPIFEKASGAGNQSRKPVPTPSAAGQPGEILQPLVGKQPAKSPNAPLPNNRTNALPEYAQPAVNEALDRIAKNFPPPAAGPVKRQ